MKYLSVLSLLFFIVYEYFDSRHLKDERENLIELKTADYAQRFHLVVLGVLSVLVFFNEELSTPLVLLTLILSSLYSEILFKIYLRKTL